jgi:hypothetical protein
MIDKTGTVRINHSTFSLKKGGEGAIVVLMYSGKGDPKIALDNAVLEITEGIDYFELIDAHLDNPWTRVVMTNINDMTQDVLNLKEHKLTEIIKKATTPNNEI